MRGGGGGRLSKKEEEGNGRKRMGRRRKRGRKEGGGCGRSIKADGCLSIPPVTLHPAQVPHSHCHLSAKSGTTI